MRTKRRPPIPPCLASSRGPSVSSFPRARSLLMQPEYHTVARQRERNEFAHVNLSAQTRTASSAPSVTCKCPSVTPHARWRVHNAMYSLVRCDRVRISSSSDKVAEPPPRKRSLFPRSHTSILL